MAAVTFTMGAPQQVSLSASNGTAQELVGPVGANEIVVYVEGASAIGYIKNSGTDGEAMTVTAADILPNKQRIPIPLDVTSHGHTPRLYLASDTNSATARVCFYRRTYPSVP